MCLFANLLHDKLYPRCQNYSNSNVNFRTCVFVEWLTLWFTVLFFSQVCRSAFTSI